MSKLKLAIYWAATCGGCDVSKLDTHERLLKIAEAADIFFWPIAMDFKYKDVEEKPDGFFDVCLFNGAVRNSENEEIAKLLRKKSKIMVAYGACSSFGGIPALANFFEKEELLKQAYAHNADTKEAIYPQARTKVKEGELTLPELYDRVYKLDDIVKVEYFIPGCPPTPDLLMTAVEAIVSGKLPPVGSTIAGEKALCDVCKREKSDNPIITEFKRPHEVIADTKKCFLEQGIVCMGPATRSGCGTQCINANMPCRGCFGPAPGVKDQGAKMLSALTGIIKFENEEQAKGLIDSMSDPSGTLYRFCNSTGLLSKNKVKK